MATLKSVRKTAFIENGEEKEGLEFTWIVNGIASENAARMRARMLTARAFPLQWIDEFNFPPTRNVETTKIDTGVIDPLPLDMRALLKTWRIKLFLPTENDIVSTPVETILKRAEEIVERDI